MEENAEWDTVSAKGACLRRLDERGFPEEMRAVADASDRFFELGVYYRNPLEVCGCWESTASTFCCYFHPCILSDN